MEGGGDGDGDDGEGETLQKDSNVVTGFGSESEEINVDTNGDIGGGEQGENGNGGGRRSDPPDLVFSSEGAELALAG